MEKQRTASKRDIQKVSKSFWRRKSKKWKYGRERYKNFSEQEKEMERQYEREHYKNLSDDQKQRIVEYKKYCLMQKITTESLNKIPVFCNDPKTIEKYTLIFFLVMSNKEIFNCLFSCNSWVHLLLLKIFLLNLIQIFARGLDNVSFSQPLSTTYEM